MEKVATDIYKNPATVFERTINAFAAKSPDGRMVLLVDEYDKPLLGHLMSRKNLIY